MVAKKISRGFREQGDRTLIHKHVAQSNHTMNFHSAKVLPKSEQEKPRKLLEIFVYLF